MVETIKKHPLTFNEAVEMKISVEDGGRVWRKIGNKIEVFNPENELYSIYVLKSKITGNFVAAVFKKVVIKSYKRSTTDLAETYSDNISTNDKLAYIKFLEKYGKFEEEKVSQS